jgi:hypothetical protein
MDEEQEKKAGITNGNAEDRLRTKRLSASGTGGWRSPPRCRHPCKCIALPSLSQVGGLGANVIILTAA